MNGEFAVSLTDMGHSGGMMDASRALDAQKRIDFAYRAQHVMANLRADEMPVLLQNPLALLHKAIIPHCPASVMDCWKTSRLSFFPNLS